MFRFQQQQQQRRQMYSSSGFQDQLRKVFEENATCVNYYVQYSLEESQHMTQLSERLTDTQQEIGNLIGHFYGVKQKLASAFVQWMGFTSEAIEVFKWKKNVELFRKRWYERTDDLIQVLNNFSDWDLRKLFYKHIALTESIIKSIIKKDVVAQQNYYTQLINTNREMSNIISMSIVKDNGSVFSR